MADISINNLNKFFGDKQVLKNITFDINQGEKVAIIGANGAGKTTFFNIISKGLDYDSGDVYVAPKNIGLIDQMPIFPSEWKVIDVLNSAFSRIRDLISKLEETSKKLEKDTENPALIKKYGDISHKIEQCGGYSFEFKIDIVCNGLLIDDSLRLKDFSVLSGGEKTRVNLARIILENADILLLDEPTNHLDMASALWLGNYLKSYEGTVVIISHDRFFIDEVCERIVEFENGTCDFYAGSYSYYAIEKQTRIAHKLLEISRQENHLKKMEDKSRMMHEWGTAKMHKRAFSIDKKIEKIVVDDRPPIQKSLKISFGSVDFHTEELLKIKNLAKSFGDKKLFENLDFTVRNGDKIAILGDNGTGKSTLLKIILSQLDADSGNIIKADGLKYGYLPQNVVFEHINRNLIDTLIYDKNLSAQTARNRLGAFHFSGEDQRKTIKVLSGGEKSRLKLCTIMYDDINILYLDEPTNHLDIISREWIEEAISSFEGTLVFISHDRYFIKRFANRVIMLEKGGYTDFRGSYSEFLLEQQKIEKIAKSDKSDKSDKNKKSEISQKSDKNTKTQKSKNTVKKIAKIELEISKLEKDITSLDEKMLEFSSDAQKLLEIMQDKEDSEKNLDALMQEWENLISE